jgi:hypothetical protein
MLTIKAGGSTDSDDTEVTIMPVISLPRPTVITLTPPAKGRSPRARISILAPFQQTGGSTDSRSSVNVGAIDHCAGFSSSLCVTLAPKPTLKSLPSIHTRCKMPASFRSTATIAHSVLDRLATRRPQARSADHFLTRSKRLAAASQSASRTLTSPCLVIRPS